MDIPSQGTASMKVVALVLITVNSGGSGGDDPPELDLANVVDGEEPGEAPSCDLLVKCTS